MLKKILPLLFVSAAATSVAQQMSDYTHYPSMLSVINPAYTGTRGNIDARADYRKQWSGFDGAPIEKTFGVNARFLKKGKVGAGFMLTKDETGPTERFAYGFSAAYHLHFPDVEFSAGIGLNFMKYTFNGQAVSIHNSHDAAIDRSLIDYDKTKNALAGIMLYNDRFHFGLGVMNMINNKAEFYVADTTKKATVTYAQHYYFSVGYNFSGDPNYVWENNLLTTYVTGTPLAINYNLRLHIREKFIVGGALRLKDAVALQAGMVILDHYQFIYAYDFGLSRLRSAHSNTHEILLAYNYSFGRKKGGYHGNKDFVRQKYNLF